MEHNVIAPALDDDFYAESYELRKAASTMTNVAIDWFRRQAGVLLKREETLSEDKTFSVLSVGSGAGDADVEIIRALLDELSPRWEKLRYVALEPNPTHREGFLQRLNEISSDGEACLWDKRLNISVVEQRFEELDLGENQPEYDLVLFVHVFYYFEEPAEIIQRALRLTKEGGQVVIVHQTPIGIPEIQRKYMRDIKGDENEMFTTADIQKLLNETVERYQFYEIDAHLDVTECLRQTEAGLKIMSFCMECDLRNLHEAKVAQILQSFWNLAEIRPNGNAFIREPIGVFILESPHTTPRLANTLGDDDPIEDYRQLAQHFDWVNLFEPKSFSLIQRDSGPLKLLEVACGTGRWLKAFLHYVPFQNTANSLNGTPEIVIDLLDPCETAISQIADNIHAPLQLGQQYVTTLQKACLPKDTYDILWSMHGFYAIPLHDLTSVLKKCLDSLNDTGIALIALGNRNSFYITFYEQYLESIHAGNGDRFTSAEDITEALTRLGIPYQIHSVIYEERIDRDDQAALAHYIINESTINSFNKDEDLIEIPISQNLTLEELLSDQQIQRFLKSFIRGSAYYFPQETQLISFGNLSALPASFTRDGISSCHGNNDFYWEGNTLQPDAAEIRRLADTTMKYVIHHQENVEAAPLAGSGVDWLYSSDVSAETEAAVELAQSVREPIPQHGMSDFDGLLHDLFERLAPHSTNDNSAGYLAYAPGGGLFQAALADFMAMSLNRYVTIFMAAPGLAAIEDQAVRWLCDIIGYPQGAGGVLTSGGSMANFVATHAARMNQLPPTRDGEHLLGTAYVSEQAHYSIEQNLILSGFPPENLRKIPSNRHDFRICLSSLRKTIEEDQAMGLKPFLLVGMAGTTNTGAVDDLWSLAQIAQDYNLWFHADAAYGGFFRLTKRGQMRLHGIELADSVTLDPHKSMFLPYGTGSLLVRDKRMLKGAFCFTGACMQPQHGSESPLPDNIMDLSPELTREFRGLRVWLPLKMVGLNPFRAQLEEKLELAQWMANQLSLIPGIRIVAQPQLSTLVFKLEPQGNDLSPAKLDDMNKRLLKEINQRGNILLSPFRSVHNVDGEFCIRIAILSFRTHRDRLEIGLRDIRDAVATII